MEFYFNDVVQPQRLGNGREIRKFYNKLKQTFIAL